jgi:2-succinyl-6-hydroxy-2,4-cyclohexadiene-1-carboxylate synthase
MIITSDPVKINIEHFNSFDKQKDTVLLLHGFTGSLEDWRDIYLHFDERYNYIGIDLIGHGKSDSPTDVNEYKTESLVNHLKNILDNLSISKVILLGYSMGGRAALNFAVSHPAKMKGLILESTSAGIKDEKDRTKRRESDKELASYIEENGTEKFAERWMDQDIFNTQRRFSDEKLKKIRRRIAGNSKTGLANTLRGFSTGKMPYLAESLNVIQSPVLLISGEFDTKYCELNSELEKKFPDAKYTIIKNAGHNTHLEMPNRFIQAVYKYQNQF